MFKFNADLQKITFAEKIVGTFSGLYINISKSRQCVLFLIQTLGFGLFPPFHRVLEEILNILPFLYSTTKERQRKKPHDVISFRYFMSRKSKSTDRNWDLSLNCTQQGHQQGDHLERTVRYGCRVNSAEPPESLWAWMERSSDECLDFRSAHCRVQWGWEHEDTEPLFVGAYFL